MDILANLRKLLGIDQNREPTRSTNPRQAIKGNFNPTESILRGGTTYNIGELGIPIPQRQAVSGMEPAQFGYEPDDNRGIVPQAYSVVQPQRGFRSPIMGATDPRLSVRSGATPYSPGEGPYVPALQDLLRRR